MSPMAARDYDISAMGFGSDIEMADMVAEQLDDTFDPSNMTEQEQIYEQQQTGEERIVKNFELSLFSKQACRALSHCV